MVQNIRNIGVFFSEYFLGQLKESDLKGRLGENTARQNLRRISKLYERAELRLDSKSPKHQVIDRWVKPLLQILGFELEKNLVNKLVINTEKESVNADFAFFPVENLTESDGIIQESPILLFDIYQWETSLSQKLGRGYDNTPLKRIRNKMSFSNAKWGMILNGPMVWLLKQQEGLEEQNFLEINLQSIIEEFDQESFNTFWGLLRAEAFYPYGKNPSLIEIVDSESRAHAAKVGEFLKVNVYEALETFMRGILEDLSNIETLKKYELLEIYHQALLFMYRLLFIFYAESLELLPITHEIYRENYSLEIIRILVEDPNIKFNANQFYLWDSLNSLFKMLDLGIDNGDLIVTAFNGYLFSGERTPILDQIRVNDKVIHNVISLLSTTPSQKYRGRERISYKELGVAQLGSIYEGLLEYEPKIAEEDLVIKKIKGIPTVISTNLDEEKDINKILGHISKGTFYMSLWGGSRKTSGSYYTPDVLTIFLVEQALKPHVEGKSSEEILKLKILDPAMGSGAFLVAACNFLADYYGQALIEEGKIENEITSKDFINHKRLIAENCLYGVDLNPMAVELAKVSLWITTAADQRPLNFLDHRLVVGNSLIGCWLEDIEYPPDDIFKGNSKTQNAKEKKRFKEQKKTMMNWFGAPFDLLSEISKILKFRGEEFLSGSDTDRTTLQNKYSCFYQLTSKKSNLSKIKQVFDLWCASWFWDDSEFPTTRYYIELVEKILLNKGLILKEERIIEKVEELRDSYKFFHFELEFPEIFFELNGTLKQDGGFDAIIGNPPWDKIKPEKNFFFPNYYPLFKDLTPKEQKKKIAELLKIEKIAVTWELYQKRIEKTSFFVRISQKYELRGTGDLNSYKLFLERFLFLSNSAGYISLVLPTSFNTDLGANKLREFIFSKNKLNYLLCFSNERNIFQGVAHNFKFCLFCLKKGDSTNSFLSCFKYDIEDSLNLTETATFLETLPKSQLFEIEIQLLQKLDAENLTIFEFKSSQDARILTKCYLKFPSFSESDQPWGAKYKTEIHMTNQNTLFNEIGDGLPLMEGRNLFFFDNKYKKWVEGRGRSAKWEIVDLKNRETEWNPQFWVSIKNIDKIDTLQLNWRVGFNDVTGPTNFRSIKSAIITPKMVCNNTIPILEITSSKIEINRKKICLFLISILNSFVLDYCVRFKIKNHLNKFIILSIPVPRFESDDWFFNQIVARASRLVCFDKEFKDFWESIFDTNWKSIKTSTLTDWDIVKKEWGIKNSVFGRIKLGDDSYDAGDRAQLRAEIDALIAHLFNLTYEEFSHILDTFAVLKNKEETMFEEFQSRRLCLQEYERLRHFIEKASDLNLNQSN